MIAFLFRKMWKNKFIMLSLLMGNILLIGIVSGTPIYIEGAMQRILIQEMEQVQLEENIHPAMVQLEFSLNSVPEEESQERYEAIKNQGIPLITGAIDIPVERMVHNLIMRDVRIVPAQPRNENQRMESVQLNTFEGFEDFITITHGRMPSDQIQEGNIIEGITNAATMLRRDMLLGELLTISSLLHGEEESYYLKIVGVYEATGEQGLFWTENPNTFTREVLVSHELVQNRFMENYHPDYRIASQWIIMFDFYSMSTVHVSDYLEAERRIRAGMLRIAGEEITYEENFISTLERYLESMGRLTTTLLVLQVPIYIFLAFYIYIISRQILRLEQNDISILKSRGTSRGQIVSIYLFQSILVSAVSVLIGIPLGLLVCRLLGASSGFLELVARVAIPAYLNRDALVYSGIAAFASMLVMLIPVIGFSKVAIIEHKRSMSRRLKRSFWQRYFLDVLFLGVSIYGYYNFNSRREIMGLAVVDVQAMDPMLFISSTLFIIGLGLFCLRLYPYLIRLIFKIGSRVWSPPSYASLLKVIRFSSDEQFIMVFLVFTLSLGIFSATTARTLNTNNEHMIQYEIGADLIFAERFRDNIPVPIPGEPVEMPDRIIYTEPDFERFTGLPQVDALTRVMVGEVDVRQDTSNISDVTMMAIETNTFGETAWYRDDLLPLHMNFFLNALALREEGVLLSNNFRTRYGFEVGQWIVYSDSYGNQASGLILGFVERWPSFSERVRVMDEGGAYVFEDRFLVVTNLGRIHTNWGIYPYQVWMRTNTASNRFFYDFVDEMELSIIHFEDAKAQVVASRSDPILQGTNGVLTAGFIFTFLASFTGYLIYWILSIKSRVLQFGVFRAMGMTKKDLIRLLINEQILISFSAIAIGSLVGGIAARLFVPMIQVAYSPSLQKIPLMVVTYGRDYWNIFGIIGLMMVLCLMILGVLISKVNMAGALKLGED